MDLEQALAKIAELEVTVNNLNVEKGKLSAKNTELLEEKRTATERLKLLDQYSNVDVDELIKFKEEAIAEKQELERQKLAAAGEFKKLEEITRQEYQQKLAEAEAKLKQEKETEAERAKRLEADLNKLKLESPILSALATISDFPGQIFQLNQNNFALNDAGKPVYRDGLTDIPIQEWVASIGNKPDLAHFVRASSARGGGAIPGASQGTRAVTSGNPFARGTGDYNLTKQGELYKTNPAEAERLKKEALG